MFNRSERKLRAGELLYQHDEDLQAVVLFCLKHKIPIYSPDSSKEIYPHTELERRAKYGRIACILYQFDAAISFLFLKHALYDNVDITICGRDISSEAYGDKTAEKLTEIEKRESDLSNELMPYGNKCHGERMALMFKCPLEAVATLNGYDVFFVGNSSLYTGPRGVHIRKDISFVLNNKTSSTQHVYNDPIQEICFKAVHFSGNNKDNAIQESINRFLDSLKDRDSLMRMPSCTLSDSEKHDLFLFLYRQSKDIVGAVRIEERNELKFLYSASTVFANKYSDMSLMVMKNTLKKERKQQDSEISDDEIEKYKNFLYINDFEYYKDKKKCNIEEDYFIFNCDEYCQLYHPFDYKKGKVAWLNNLKKFMYDIELVQQFSKIATFDDAKKWLISYYEDLIAKEDNTRNKIRMHLYILVLNDKTYRESYEVLKKEYPSLRSDPKTSNQVNKQCNRYIKRLEEYASNKKLPYIDFKKFPSTVKGRGSESEKDVCASLIAQIKNRYDFR